MTGVASKSKLGQDEVFGPLLGIIEAKDFDDAVALANDVRFGLSASICTTNVSRALEYVERAEAGMVMVNLPSAGVEYHIPFGGTKDSSSGWREQGPAATQFFTESKTVYMKYLTPVNVSPAASLAGELPDARSCSWSSLRVCPTRRDVEGSLRARRASART